MARILKMNMEDTEIECDCGNSFYGAKENNGFLCYKCGKFYEVVLNFCPEHRQQ